MPFIMTLEADGGKCAVPNTFSVPSNYKAPRLDFPEIGVGCRAWGDPRRGWGQTFNSTDVAEAFEICNDAGVCLFDTSEVYGFQSVKLSESSEQLISSLVASSMAPPMISTKFMPVPWTNLLAGAGVRMGRHAVVDAARASIARLGLGSLDLYSLHAPLPYIGGRRALYEGLAEVYSLGLCRGVGLCNFGAAQLREACVELRRLGVPVVANQIRYSVMNIERELDGTIETCLELGVTPVAHTPLAGGLATEYYSHALARRGGRRGRVGRYDSKQLVKRRGEARTGTHAASGVPLAILLAIRCLPVLRIECAIASTPSIEQRASAPSNLTAVHVSTQLTLSHMFETMSAVSEEVSTESSPRSEAQVALRFAVAKGCVPIPGVNNAAQAREVTAAMDWALDLSQAEALSEQAVLLHSRRRELSWLKGL